MTLTPAPAASAARPEPAAPDLPATAVLPEVAPLPDLPPLPAAAPRLARSLHWALTTIRALAARTPQAREGLDEDYAEAVALLAALPDVPPATVTLAGADYWCEEDGTLVPAGLVKPQRRMEDELVRGIAAGALGVQAILQRYRTYSMAETAAYQAQLAQDYAAARGAAAGEPESDKGKGNVSYYSYDRAWRVQVARADRIVFGPEIQVARTLLLEWVREQPGADTLKALINSALGLDREGKIRAAEVLRLRSYDIADAKWQAAMKAITDSIRSGGTAEYLRVYRRGADGRYQLMPLDLANA